MNDHKQICAAYFFSSINRGGLETLMLDVFQNDNKAQFDFIGIYRKEGSLSTQFRQSTKKIYKCRPQLFHYLSYIYTIRKILKEHNVNIIHAQSAIDAFLALIVSRFTNIKVVTTFHGHFISNRLIDYLLNKFVISSVDANIFVSEHLKQHYLSKFKSGCDRSFVVYNGINLDKLKYRSKPLLNNTKYILGTVGNFSSARSPIVICKFLELLKKHGCPFVFYFVGKKSIQEPSVYDECVMYCNEHDLRDEVKFLGTRDDVPDLLSSWHAFIYSTIRDTFGISVIEAIASGLPVFTNDIDVMKEVTDNGKLGRLYSDGNEKELFRIFKEFFEGDLKRVEMDLRHNLEDVQNMYSLERHFQNLANIYNSII